MKSWQLETGAKSELVEHEMPAPKPQPEQILVRVRAAGVIMTELGWYPTTHTQDGGVRSGTVPSHEFSGEIAATGGGVTGLRVGDEVYGMNDWFQNGALAEFCITRPEWIAPKPRSLSHPEAASVPISALTAWQGLFDRARLQPGESVLVHGGTGAVGTFAVQLAHSRGAHVITTVSSRNFDLVRELGADEMIDYQKDRFQDKVRDLDVVFDTVGGESLSRSWQVLGPKGRLVTVVSEVEGADDERRKQAFFIVEARHQQLVEVGRMLDRGELRTVVDVVVPWAQAAEAYAGRVRRTGRGKIVVAVNAASIPARSRGQP